MTQNLFRRVLPVMALASLLAGCGANDNDPGPGGVTVGEARALDEAAAMLDERRAKTFAEQQAAGAQTPPPVQQSPAPAPAPTTTPTTDAAPAQAEPADR